MIENKWNDDLSDRQLERYAEYLLAQRPVGGGHRRCLVYLTRSGEEPGVALPVDFVRLSYSEAISRLLQTTIEQLRDTAPSALREPLLQFCQILDGNEPDGMAQMVAFFHESDHLARRRELREALDQFETRMPERIEGRIMSKLPIEERAPSGWSRFQRFSTPRDAGFYGFGWECHEPAGELTDWVGFGWWCSGKHDYLLVPQDAPGNPCRWIGWWKPGTESRSAEETRLFNEAHVILGDRLGGLLDRSLLDGEPHHDDGWPYYHGVSAAEVNALQVDTDEFATALSRLLPLIRHVVEQSESSKSFSRFGLEVQSPPWLTLKA